MIVDRRAERRGDAEFLASARRSPYVVPVWRSRNLVNGDRPPRPVVLEGEAAVALVEASDTTAIFLGTDAEERPYFAVELSARESHGLDSFGTLHDLKVAGAFMAEGDFGMLAYARGMCRWHRVTRHCHACGGILSLAEAGFSRVCNDCEERVFPRTDPAVMVLCTRENQCLLARQPRFPSGMYSALAGFVEPGESLEHCVRREVGEEVGLRVERLVYRGSQAWPFPDSLMVGFRAEVAAGEVVLDEEELEAARWVTRDELCRPAKQRDFFTPPPMSLAHRLLSEWVQAEPGDGVHE